MDNKKKYQKPEVDVILVETEGEVFVLSGNSPGADKNPGEIKVADTFFKNSEGILGGNE